MARSPSEQGSIRLRLDHIGIAVEDLEKARTQYARLLGVTPSPVEEVPVEWRREKMI